MLSIQNLSFSYPQEKELRFADLIIEKQQHTLILGDSGSGKTTLLNLIGGLSKPTTGTVSIINQDIYQLNESKLDKFRGQHIGFIFQDAHLLKNLTLQENIKLAQSLAGNAVDLNKINKLLENLQLQEFAAKRPNQLSRGQLQRAAIARAIVNSPAILIADEPTASLDDNNTSRVLSLLQQMANQYDSTLIISTHDKRIKEEFSNTYLLS